MAMDDDELLEIRKNAQIHVQKVSSVDLTMETVTNIWRKIR